MISLNRGISLNRDYDDIIKGRKERRANSRAEKLARKVDGRCVTCGKKHGALEAFCDVCERIVDQRKIETIHDVEWDVSISVCIDCKILKTPKPE